MTGVQTCALPILQVYGQWQQLLSQPLQQIAVQSLLAVPLAVLGIGGIRHLCSQSQDHRWVPWLLLGAALVPLPIMLAVTYTVRPVLLARTLRSEERRVGKECVSTGISRGAPSP